MFGCRLGGVADSIVNHVIVVMLFCDDFLLLWLSHS
jgi:hypothetical protein